MDWNMLSKNQELAKQWEAVDETQMKIFEDESELPMLVPTPENPEAEVVVGLTVDSRNEHVEIYRSDVLQMFNEEPTTLSPVDKMLLMIARYSNQTHSQNPPYCIVLRGFQSESIWDGRYEEASRTLDAMQATEENFFAINFIFIPLLLGPPLLRTVLLVVSPFYKAVELLDSDCSGSGIGEVEDKLLGGIFRLLVIHLPRRFNTLDWWIRRGAALQQTFGQSQSLIAVISNAMAIAFGYEISGWMSVFVNDSIFPDGSIDWYNNMTIELRPRDYHSKRIRAATELLHGRFEPYTFPGDDGMSPFSYRFGSHIYREPLTTYRIYRNGIIATLYTHTIEFKPLFESPCVQNFALGGPCVEPNDTPPNLPMVDESVEKARERRLDLARQSLMAEFGVEVVVNLKPQPSGR